MPAQSGVLAGWVAEALVSLRLLQASLTLLDAMSSAEAIRLTWITDRAVSLASGMKICLVVGFTPLETGLLALDQLWYILAKFWVGGVSIKNG